MTYREELEMVGEILGIDIVKRVRPEAIDLLDHCYDLDGITGVNRCLTWTEQPEGLRFWDLVDDYLKECGWPRSLDKARLRDMLMELRLMGV